MAYGHLELNGDRCQCGYCGADLPTPAASPWCYDMDAAPLYTLILARYKDGNISLIYPDTRRVFDRIVAWAAINITEGGAS